MESSRRRVIVLGGRKHVGKTTAANYLQRKGYMKIGFANPIRAMLYTLYTDIGISPDHAHRMVYGDKKEEHYEELNGLSHRNLAETLGTEWGRHCNGTSFWSVIWEEKVKRALDEGCYGVVCDDLRFQNETYFVHQLGGIVVRIKRPEAEVGKVDHPSDAAEFSADHVIWNNGTLDDLYSRLDDVMWNKE